MEIIKAKGVSYDAEKVTTSTNSISFTVRDKTAEEMKTEFQDATELTVSDTDGNEYGVYKNLSFESVTEYADGTVTVTMHIPTALELEVKQLQVSQAEQDDAIAELYGMEV